MKAKRLEWLRERVPHICWFNLAAILTLLTATAWIVILFFSMASAARAGTADLTWTAPTTNCNGTPLTNLTGYSLLYGRASESLPLTPMSKTITGLTPGLWWFSLASVNSDGERSEFITVDKTVAPEEFVTVGTAVYTFVKNDDRIITLPVGTVALGVQCDAAQSVNGKYVIPRSVVSWSGSVRPVVVVADCG